MTTFAHTDALGSPVARTTAAGALQSRTRFEPYGSVAAGTIPGTGNQAALGFTGHVNDADTGLVYMQQRYYDPVAGRFLSLDPVTTDANTGDGFNRYVYGNNNPYRFIDPEGLEPFDAFGLPSVGGKETCDAVCRNIKRDWRRAVVCVLLCAGDKRPPEDLPKPPTPERGSLRVSS